MTDLLARLVESASRKEPPASKDVISETETILGVTLPQDLRSLLLVSNGLAADIGDLSIYLWSAKEIVELTQDYGIDRYVPGMIMIGSNTNLKCFCLDYRMPDKTPVLCCMPWGDIDPGTVQFVANSLTDFVIAAQEGRITNRQIENGVREILDSFADPVSPQML